MVLCASLGLTSELGHQQYIKVKRLSLACGGLRASDLSNEGVNRSMEKSLLVCVMLSQEEPLLTKELLLLRGFKLLKKL